jgi:Zn-dependent protease with chaperone function
MSRSEIDALAAHQLARQQREYLLPARASLLGCGLAAAGLCELLNVGIAGRWLAFLVLVAAETAALALYFPHVEVKADLRAIRLTGNPDAFFSALGESARLNGAALDLPALEKIARRTGVSADRLRALFQQQHRPAEDRYPTSGDYVTVGF